MEQQLSLLDHPEQQEEEVAMCCMEAHESDGTLVCGVCGQVQGTGEPLMTGKYHGKRRSRVCGAHSQIINQPKSYESDKDGASEWIDEGAKGAGLARTQGVARLGSRERAQRWAPRGLQNRRKDGLARGLEKSIGHGQKLEIARCSVVMEAARWVGFAEHARWTQLSFMHRLRYPINPN